jgi:hypothetical protein
MAAPASPSATNILALSDCSPSLPEYRFARLPRATQVMPSLKVQPAEFRMVGRKSLRNAKGYEVLFGHGEGVSSEAAAFLREQLETRRWTIRQVMGLEKAGDPSFLEELELRGYDMTSLRFSIFTLQSGKKLPKRLTIPAQKPGHLHARWGRLEYDRSGDLVSTWSLPATRCDSSMFQGFLSMASFKPGTPFSSGMGFDTLMDQLKARGFDIRTLRFSVKHKDPIPG